MFIIRSIIIGFLTGILASNFGIGGSVLSKPAVRILLDQPANISIGTPLAVIIPTAISGSIVYWKSGLIEKNLFLYLTWSGLLGVVSGALLTKLIKAEIIMILTALVLLYLGLIIMGVSEKSKIWRIFSSFNKKTSFKVGTGFFAGLYSGFLGLGGGTILVPMLVFIYKLDFKKAIATSLSVISFYVFPGVITHYLIGNVRLDLAFWLVLGVVPGVYLGTKMMIGGKERTIRFLFGLFLVFISLYFLYFELTRMKLF